MSGELKVQGLDRRKLVFFWLLRRGGYCDSPASGVSVALLQLVPRYFHKLKECTC